MTGRRQFLAMLASWPPLMPWVGTSLPAAGAADAAASADRFHREVERLLTDWCDGLVRRQITAPDDPRRHGAIDCAACSRLHGRVIDCIYPLFCVAARTGDRRYLEAALALDDWTANVEGPEGAWLNDPEPKAWKGTTVFHAIARADAIHHHAALIGATRVARWKERLREAGRFIVATIDYGKQNINYALTAPLALQLLGDLLDEPAWIARARELAARAAAFRTEPHRLFYGEGRPYEAVTPKGCRPVDLGYNVEESIPALVRYARLCGDRDTERLALAALDAHLEFMLPDGGWDNGWGSRSFKWTWWGSRTSDGCLAALLTGATERPVFATAAVRHLDLLGRCTAAGLLAGGPHLATHGVEPCIHHTFAHAKVLAEILDEKLALPEAVDLPQLPREVAAGVRAYPEVGCLLVAHGPWRATVSGYDVVYGKDIFTATGGTLPVVWHVRAGTVCVASPPRLTLVEPMNMCANRPGEERPLSVRVEADVNGRWLTNLFDRAATITHEEQEGRTEVRVATRLLDEQGGDAGPGAEAMRLTYRWAGETFTIRAEGPSDLPWRLVLPLVSPAGERVGRPEPNRLTIARAGGLLGADVRVGSLDIPADADRRTFNMVPGCEAVKVVVLPQEGRAEVSLTHRG
jgi:hypothetical protein